MKKLLAVALLLLAGPALAQETYSVAATVNQVARLDRGRVVTNRATCARLSLAASCTQAQACTAANAAGGASCTAAQARAANAQVYANSQAGREDFLLFGLTVPRLNDLAAQGARTDAADYCVWYSAQNQTAKDAECSKIGAPASCDLCQ